MADSQEETVNGHIITFFIRFTHTMYQMHPFHTVLSKQAYGIMFEQNFNLVMLHHTLLHNLGSAEIRFADNQINLGSQSGKVNGFFAGSISTPYNSYRFLAVEETITSGTSADTHPRIFLFILQSQILRSGTRSNNQRFSLNHLFVINCNLVRCFSKIGGSSDSITQICTKTFGLLPQVFH